MYQMRDRYQVSDHVFSIILNFLSRFTSDTIGCRIRDHLKSKAHQAASKVTTVVQLLPNVVDKMVGMEERNDHFRDKLLEAWIAADIPLDKLLNPKLRAFLQWLINSEKMDVKLPNPRTLRRNTMKLFSRKREEIRKRIRGNDVYLLIDETPDAESRNVVNVMVGILDGNVTKPWLVNVSYPKIVDNLAIRKIVVETCSILWRGKNVFPHLKVIISDQAAYMLLAVRKLKENDVSFPHLKHVTCVIHAANLVCDSIRKQFTLVNLFLSKEKKFFKNSGKKKRDFKEKTGLKLPPFPILVRWGSWLKCVNYHLNGSNFAKIKKFFLETGEENGAQENQVLKDLKKILSGEKLENDLLELSQYSYLPALMTTLEKRSLSLIEQVQLVAQIRSIISGSVHEDVLNSSLAKNPDYLLITGCALPLEERLNLKFCPLANSDIERSFSTYRSLLSDRRRSFTTENLKHMMIIKCNSDL